MFRKSLVAVVAATTLALTACGGGSDSGGGSDAGGASDGTITMGFAQVGAESGWRTANTKSVQEAAEAAGVDLKFSDAQQKQENQIKAIRSYIQQQVDVIAFSPVVESGWDTVLKEAKDAEIPVILTDRAVDSADTSLYKTFLGSDFIEEGKKAGDWVVEEYADADSVKIIEDGSASVSEAGASMGDIVASVRQVNDIIGRISVASTEQADGIAEVNKAVGQMDGMTQQNAALVEQAAAAAESLHEQTVNLAKAVSIFKFDGEEGPAIDDEGEDGDSEAEDEDGFHGLHERRAPGSAMRGRAMAALPAASTKGTQRRRSA